MPILIYIVMGTVRESSLLAHGLNQIAPAVSSALKTFTTLCAAETFSKSGENYSSKSLEVSLVMSLYHI